MKRLLILLLVAVSCSMYGQQTVTYDQLARTKWNREVNDWEGKTAYSKWFYTMEFTDSLLIYSSYGVTYDKRTNESHKSGTAIRWFLYYLSPEEPSAFDYSKVGKNSSGQYLVMHNIGSTTTIYGHPELTN